MTPNSPRETSTKFRGLLWGLAGCVLLLIAFGVFSFRETNKEQARRLLAEARALRLVGKYAEAETQARQALERDPALGEAALIAAESAVAQNHFEKAVAYAQQVPDDPPDDRLTAWLLIAELNHRQIFHLAVAEEAYRAALAIDGDSLKANTGLADLLGLCGRGHEAVPFVLRMVRQGRASSQLMLIARQSGAVDNIEALESAHWADPQDVNALLGLAWHAASDGRNEEALGLLQTALKIQPENPAAFVAAGRQLLTLGRFTDLADWAERIPSAAGEFGETWFLKGRLAEHQHEQSGAIRCYWEDIQRVPESKESNFRLAKLLNATNQPAQAEGFVKQVHRIDHLRTVQDRAFSQGSTEKALLELIAAYKEAGRLWEAYGWCQLVNQIHENDPKLMEELKTLRDQTQHLPLRLTADFANPAMQVDLSSHPLPRFHQTEIASDVDSSLPTAKISFHEEAATVGLRFRYFNGTNGKPARRMYEFPGGGIGVLDFDLDGFPDACFSQGCPWPPSPANKQYLDQLFRNRQGRSFENVTDQAGLSQNGFGQGVAVGDYNADGFPDLYLAGIGLNALWTNNGDGTFSNATAEANLQGKHWTTSCLMADLNGDGLPDLYDVNYLMGQGIFERVCRHPDGTPALCMPFDFEGEPDCLWLNAGDGRFTEATAEMLSIVPAGKGLGVMAWDADASGHLSVLVANDTTPNFFFVPECSPQKGCRLEERGIVSGLAFNGEGKAEGCMGIALADIDGNGALDVHITNFLAESNTLWMQQSPGLYEDKTQPMGLREPTLNVLGFGTQFLDANLDGRWELFAANGHIDDLTALGKPHAMRAQLFEWNGTRFQEADAKTLGAYFQKKWLGRAAARLDWNRDGLADLLVGHLDQDSALLTNTTKPHGRFLFFEAHRQAKRP